MHAHTPSPLDPYMLVNYSAWLRSWGASPRTRTSRLGLARRAAALWPDPAGVTEGHLIDFLADEGFSTWTRATYFGHFRSLFGWLTRAGAIAVDPTLDLRRPNAGQQRPRPLTVADANRAQAAATGDTYALLMLGMLAGLRAHEAAKVHARDVSDQGLYVLGKGGHEAVLPLHPTLRALADERDGYWFPGLNGRDHITERTVSLRCSKLFTPLGIEGSFHRCRHYYGTALLRAGVNIRVVQELMRHASLATTAAYLGVGEDEKTAAILSLAA